MCVKYDGFVGKNGQTLNSEKLSYGLGVPVVEISALKNRGLDHALKQSKQRANAIETEVIYPSYDNRLEAALAEIVDILGNTVPETQQRWYSLKLLNEMFEPRAIIIEFFSRKRN